MEGSGSPLDLMKSNLASTRLFATVPLSFTSCNHQFFLLIFVHEAMKSRCSQSTALKRGANSGELSYSETSALFASPALKTTRQSHRHPSLLPGTRLKIRPRWFHIHSRHLLAKYMIQYKPELIHGLSHSQNQICVAKSRHRLNVCHPLTTARAVFLCTGGCISPERSSPRSHSIFLM